MIDKFSQFTLLAAREAVKDAAIEWTDEQKENTCVITGTSIGGQDSQEDIFISLYKEQKSRHRFLRYPGLCQMPVRVISLCSMGLPA
jgi:3-oxoacyl-(acyl-carrier-protein) synthase